MTFSLRPVWAIAALAACSPAGNPSPPARFSASDSRSGPLASSYGSLYSFGQNGKQDDGRGPVAGLVALGGALFGTTFYGGVTNSRCVFGCGIVFKATTSGTESVVYRFRAGADGFAPAADLLDVNGDLFGTTSAGGDGKNCGGGCGTVFKVSPNGAHTVIYRFKGAPDGAAPFAGVIDVGGVLYGTTQSGGARKAACFPGCGTVFRVNPDGTAEKVIYRFKAGADGAQPIAALTAAGGVLYGTTEYGGTRTHYCAIGCGTIFSVTPGGTEKVLYRFKYAPHVADGANPSAALIGVGGTFYGTTLGGGMRGVGTVFSVTTSGSEHVLASFPCCAKGTQGSYPVGRLSNVSAALFSTTRGGGMFGVGTVFKITTSGVTSVLYNFRGKPDGAGPQAGLLSLNGALYGTTTDGGTHSEGTLFKITP
jgi:uncharacterized repeat protein (TIGR03803 family)